MRMQGRRYKQKELKLDLTWSRAGQSTISRLLLFFLIILFCLLLSFVSSYQGGALLFLVATKTFYKPEYLLVTLNTVFWLVGTSVSGWKKGIWITVLAAIFLFLCLRLLEYFGFLVLPSSFTISLVVNLVYNFVICGNFFLVIRLLIAIIEITFYQSKLIKILIISSVTLVSFSACLNALIDSLENVGSISGEVTQPFLPLIITTVLGGFGLTSSLVATALIANQHRHVPWHYPDSIREVALAFGSWGGTSFYGLNLSNVNFTGTKLANTDLRAKKFYRTCLQGVTGLERARVDNQYLDLAYPKVQKLLAHGSSSDSNFSKFNLQGAYLRNADMRGFDLTDTNLTGADLKGADLRGSRLIRTQLAEADLEGVDLRTNILIDSNLTEVNFRGTDLRNCIFVRAQVARADFTGADLTGACIEDWSISNKTTFTNVRCDYVFRRYEDGQPSHRYPSDRNFEPGEFAALFQQPENELELIFKGDFSYSALSLAFYKLKTEKPELDLELKGIEQRGNLWVVRVTSSNPTVEAQLEQQFSEVYQTTTNSDSLETTIKDSIYRDYEDIKQRLAESQQLVRQFAGISESQAEALKQLSKQAFGTNFYIEGSAITNLTGQGQIEYTEAAGQIRSLVTQSGTETQVSQVSQQVLVQLQDIAMTPPMQTELIQQILLKEAQKDPAFRNFLSQQQQQILTALPPGAIAAAIQGAIAQLNQG